VPDGPPPVPVSHFGDADRDRLTVVLREHYALGRIDIDEFARRVEIVLAADYADEAAAAVRDLPPLGAAAAGAAAAPGQGSHKRMRRRHAQAAVPGAGWLPTSERFRDPTSGTIMRVWLDPADQSRHYVPDTAS
jgi:nucleotidyltransferase/DNA polymerase involved in DNA repair